MKLTMKTALQPVNYGKMITSKIKKMIGKKEKKAQIKIQQMSFMLIAVTLFFVVAGLFILMITLSNLKQSATVLQENNAILLVSKIADSPEFSCGSAFGQPMTNCIDTDKLMALENKSKDYSGFWGVSGIEVIKIYPVQGQDIECTPDNYPNCSKMTIIPSSNGTGVSNFVSLCRKDYQGLTYNKCELGRIVVVYNS